MNNIATYFASDGPDEVGAWQTPFQMHPAVPGRIVSAKKALHFSDDGGETWSHGEAWHVRSTAWLCPLLTLTLHWWPRTMCFTGETQVR